MQVTANPLPPGPEARGASGQSVQKVPRKTKSKKSKQREPDNGQDLGFLVEVVVQETGHTLAREIQGERNFQTVEEFTNFLNQYKKHLDDGVRIPGYYSTFEHPKRKALEDTIEKVKLWNEKLSSNAFKGKDVLV